MKIKGLANLIVAGSLALSGVVFAQAMEVTGKVTAVTNNMVTVQTTTGVWQVTRGSDVKVTGDLKVGSTVTINCSQTDAQKKEGPAANN